MQKTKNQLTSSSFNGVKSRKLYHDLCWLSDVEGLGYVYLYNIKHI